MPRYYFRVHDEWGEAADDQGAELRDLDEARSHAIAGARSLMSDSVIAGVLNLTAYIQIEADGGQVLERVTFRDALSLTE